MNDIRGEAEEFDVCYDSDVEGEDPYCMAEDLGEDPEGLQVMNQYLTTLDDSFIIGFVPQFASLRFLI